MDVKQIKLELESLVKELENESPRSVGLYLAITRIKEAIFCLEKTISDEVNDYKLVAASYDDPKGETGIKGIN